MNYQWLIDRLSSELKDAKITGQSHDYDTAYSICMQRGDRRYGVMVERIVAVEPLEWGDVEQDDGSVKHDVTEWRYEKRSLNENPNKEELVTKLINEWKSA